MKKNASQTIFQKGNKIWKEDIEYYTSLSKNPLLSKQKSHKRQKTVDSPRYLSFSEREDSPVKFKISRQNQSPRVNPFYTPSTLKTLA